MTTDPSTGIALKARSIARRRLEIGGHLVTPADEARGRERRGFRDSHHLEREIPIHD